MKIPDEQLILTGWKEILPCLGCKDKRTARKWIKHFSLPIMYVGGRPHCFRPILENWYKNFTKKPKM